MTKSEMSNRIVKMMGDTVDDDVLSVYLDQAEDECLAWEYGQIGIPEDVDTTKYHTLMVNAVVVGFTLRGAEGESQHSENGILRGFKYSDMAEYIHRNLSPYVKVR